MALLTIAGTTYPVQTTRAQQTSVLGIGSARRTFNGSLRVGIKAQKRTWSFQLAPQAAAAVIALQAAVALGALVSCTGDFSNGAAVTCMVDITSIDYYQPNATVATLQTVALTLTEA